MPVGAAFCGKCGTALIATPLPPVTHIVTHPVMYPKSSRTDIAAVGLLTVLAAKPLLKWGVLLGLMLLLIVGGADSGLGVGGGVLLALFVLVFLFWPRRRS